jgi:hypothetical protein
MRFSRWRWFSCLVAGNHDGCSPSSPLLALWLLILGGQVSPRDFFGPLMFSPDANQGPLVGILNSGPGGAVVGVLFFGFAD